MSSTPDGEGDGPPPPAARASDTERDRVAAALREAASCRTRRRPIRLAEAPERAHRCVAAAAAVH